MATSTPKLRGALTSAASTKPAEIAEWLGKDISEINNAQKRLRRKVENIMKPKGGKR
jgi:hypothetical protein